MTILLEDPPQFRWQTDLGRLLPTIQPQVEKLNWVVSNLQCWHIESFLPLIQDWEKAQESNSYVIIPGKMLYEALADQDIQIVWGVFCGVSGEVSELTPSEVPYADGNRELWTEPEAFLLASSEIEIVCFDSDVTLVKFRDDSQGHEFLKAFPDGQILRKPIED